MDYTFLMEDDTYIHVEFQTTDKGKEEQAIETAKIAIKKGLSDELICELTGLTESQISIIRKSINN